MSNNITHIFFDLGNVLVNVHMNVLYENFSKLSGIPVEEMPATLEKLTKEYLMFQHGNITKSDYFSRMRDLLETNPTDEELERAYCEMFSFNADVYGIKQEFDGKFRFSIISNTDELHFNYIMNKYSEFDVFENNTTSYEENCMKPEKYIYEQALLKNNAEPENSVFIDDLKENVKSAGEMGLKAIQYKTPAQLRRELSKLELF